MRGAVFQGGRERNELEGAGDVRRGHF